MESSISGGASMLGGFLVAYIIILLFSLALGITFYVFSSLGLYSHAKRHNISNPWLAWLPVGNYWVSGKLADLATANKPGKKMNYTKWLMGLSIGLFGTVIVYLIAVFGMVGSIFGNAVLGADPDAMFGSMFIWIAVIMLFAFLLYGVSIAVLVIWSIGMYHVYLMYCTKGVSVAFAILGGLFGLHGIFLFAIRNKPLLPPQVPPFYTNVPPQGWPQYNPPQGYYPPQNPQA